MEKYRVLQVGNLFYPQYKKYMWWYDFKQRTVHGLSSSVYYFSLEEAEEYIKNHIDSFKPTEIKIHKFNARPNTKAN